jgi:lysophospholipase L1-like esterase
VSTYLRVAALGDSITVGIGDPVVGGWRGWVRHLTAALSSSYDVSLCVTAEAGATTPMVAARQLAAAVSHRPDLVTLVVGVNDTLRAGWDPTRTRVALQRCAEELTGAGALLLTIRYHDLPRAIGLPELVARPLRHRIAVLNDAYDEVHGTYGGVRLDLGQCPEVLDRSCLSVDRLHPSERGHRALARGYAALLAERGYHVELPSLECSGGLARSWRRDARWLVADGGPWVGRRVRDLGPWAAELAWTEAVRRTGGERAGRADGLARRVGSPLGDRPGRTDLRPPLGSRA